MVTSSYDYITHNTPNGERLLAQSKPLRQALEIFINAQKPELSRIPGARLLGAGKYSFVFNIDGTAVKVGSHTSSQRAFDEKRPLPPEDLELQFTTMSSVAKYLHGNNEGIQVPEQFFVAHTPHGAYILAQQLMDGWIPLEERTAQVYGEASMAPESMEQEIKGWSKQIALRLERTFANFPERTKLNDLVKEAIGVHGSNLLVPSDATLHADVPICIIDQPGGRKS